MPLLNPDNSTLAERVRAMMESPPPLPPPRVRTCQACFKTFHQRDYRPHIRNDCGSMINVDQLRAEIQKHANLSGEDSISLEQLAVTIEMIAVSRMSAINAGLPEDQDMVVRVDKKRTSLLDNERKTRERAERRLNRRAERGVRSVTEKVSTMTL